MIKRILTAAALSFAAATATWALPVSPTAPLPPLDSSDLIQVGHGHGHGGGKNYNKHYNYNKNYNYKYHGGGKYYYRNRYWGHRYNYRPYNWQGLGCVVVGPVWYCP